MTRSTQTPSNRKSVIIGLYGIPGCGKTYLLKQLEQTLGKGEFAFYDDTRTIASIFPEVLGTFEIMEEQQSHWQRSIATIVKECDESGKVGIVASSYMFCAEDEEDQDPRHTQNDLDIYSQIIYLDTPAETIVKRVMADTERSRPRTSVNHLQGWQEDEKIELRNLCRQRRILFSSMPYDHALKDWIIKLLQVYRYDSEEENLSCAERRVDDIVAPYQKQVTTMLVLDADRTLASQDTGLLFWKLLSKSKALCDGERTLEKMFDSPLEYSYLGFRQAILIYEEIANDQEYDEFCQEVASMVTLHPEFVSLLQLVEEQEYISAVVVTSGLRRIWEKVLAREGFSKSLSVIGGGRIADGFVVTAKVKGALTARLRKTHGMYVWAFGDSPLDVDMLHEADQGIVVVGEEWDRSPDMDEALKIAIGVKDGLQARQVLLPNTAKPRLPSVLPIVKITDPEFIKALLGDKYIPSGLKVLCASDKNPRAVQLLATPMRHAAIADPELRRTHRRIGHYLAIEYMSNVIGLEPSPVEQVRGYQTSNFRLFHEEQTTILALMPGGTSMAMGITEAFPLATFLQTGDPNDVTSHHLDGQLTLVLVDAVINTGKSIIQFVQHIRKLNATIRIMIVVDVVQAQCVHGGSLEQAFADQSGLHLIALRTSETTDTGKAPALNRPGKTA